MNSGAIFTSILAALLIGAMSPGPSFVLVSRISVSMSRRNGVAAALGMGIGGAIFGFVAVLGLAAILVKISWLYALLRIMGGLYLLYLAVRIWKGARAPLILSIEEQKIDRRRSVAGSFGLGLTTQLSNPKTAIVYGSIFAAFLPSNPDMWVVIALPPAILAIESAWYVIVAMVFSHPRPKQAYLRFKLWIDRLTAGVLGVLGLRLVTEGLIR
ncbi:LysE family translocator [Rhizobium sp. NPDC090279]|uniref:LysE family translocator n=1 Tax=Rhizobium sp. NPDC090279 TaxID=3364499 RepID=UPI00383BF37B